MSELVKEITDMIEMLSASEQQFTYDFVKRLVLAWDPDFTKLTPRESEELKSDMTTETVPASEINWDSGEPPVA